MACVPRRIRFLLTLTLLGSLTALSGCDLLSKENRIKIPERSELKPADHDPAWGPGGDRIVYYHDAAHTDDSTDVEGLYLLNLETDSTRLLVEGYASSPDWRPDGKRIAFSTRDIYTIRPDGSDLQQVTDHGSAFFPSWSPDGTRLAYDATTLPQSGIWLVDPDGSSRKNLGLGRNPDWSPAYRLVYEGPPGTSESGPQLWVADTSATDSTQLTDNDFVNNDGPAWSPNGKWIAWYPITEDKQGGFWIMRSDGHDKRQLLAESRAADPAWGPNSQRLVFSKPARNSDYWALWIVNRDGSNLRQLTTPSRNPLNE